MPVVICTDVPSAMVPSPTKGVLANSLHNNLNEIELFTPLTETVNVRVKIK